MEPYPGERQKQVPVDWDAGMSAHAVALCVGQPSC